MAMFEGWCGGWTNDNEERVAKILSLRNECYVTKEINKWLRTLKEYYKVIKGSSISVNRFEQIKDYSEYAIGLKKKIQTLALVLFPEYECAKIDQWSLNKYLDGEDVMIKVCLFNGIEIKESAYVFFEPNKK